MAQKFAGLFLMTFKDETGRKAVGAAGVALRSLWKAEETQCFALGRETQRFAVGGGSPEGRGGAPFSGGGHVGRGRLGG